jgi:hypothetical protein
MNWDAIGAIGQTLGSVAVFVTLGYLAVQARNTRDEARRSVSQYRADGLRQIFMTRAVDARLAAIRVKGETALRRDVDPDPFEQVLVARGLTREEATALFYDELALYNARYPTVYHLNQLSDGQRWEFDSALRGHYGSPGISCAWYQSVKEFLNPEVVRYIDNLLAQPG